MNCKKLNKNLFKVFGLLIILMISTSIIAYANEKRGKN